MVLKIIKGFAAILLLLTFLKMPYGYYTLLRWIVFGLSIYYSYRYWELPEKGWAMAFLTIALIFNPIFLISFGKLIWSVVDLLVAIYYLISIIKLDKR